jgi:hypothetical protein
MKIGSLHPESLGISSVEAQLNTFFKFKVLMK